MKHFNNFLLIVLLVLSVSTIAADTQTDYVIDGNRVYIDDEFITLEVTPHTMASSGYTYMNLTSKMYTGDADIVFFFNTSVAKPSKPQFYKPHWVNTTSQHSKTFYNVQSFTSYYGDNLDYGNVYNTNYSYSVVHEVPIYNETTMEIDGHELITSNASFDSFSVDGVNRTIYWHDRHDKYVLWQDMNIFSHKTINWQGWTDAYVSQDTPITQDVEYLVRSWLTVPVGRESSNGKYSVAIKPSHETISQAITAGHLYILDPWWNSSWDYSKTLTINQSLVNDSIGTGVYPMLVSITDSDLAAHAQADGDDIVFTLDGVQLAHELEDWNSTSGGYVGHVGVSDIANISAIDMYYGNAAATNTENASGVFANNFVMVQHMNQDPSGSAPQMIDSTANDNDGTSNGAMLSEDLVTGQIDGALALDGMDDYVDCGDFDIDGDGTISAWINPSDVSGYNSIVAKCASTGALTSRDFSMFVVDGVLKVSIGNNSASQSYVDSGLSITADQLQFVAASIDGDNIKFYKDTSTSSVGQTVVSAGNVHKYSIGRLGEYDGAVNTYFNGVIDGVHISNSARSAGWIATEYNNQFTPALFISVGAEQSDSGDTAPTADIHISYFNPLNESANIIFEVSNSSCANYINVSWDNTTAGYTYALLDSVDTELLSFDTTSNNELLWFNGSLADGVYHITEALVPPASITGLTNSTGNFWHEWTWTNPTDADFNHTMIYINGVFATNTSNTTELYNLTASPHNTSTISTHTVDLQGHINSTWINHTSTIGNNAPTLAGLPNCNTNEDVDFIGAFDLDTYYTDADGDTASYQVQSNNQSSNVTVTIQGGNTVDYTLAANWYGSAEITFNVSDGYGGTANDTILLTVNSVNDPPNLSPIGSKIINENQTLNIDVDATDTEGDVLTYLCNRTDLFTNFNTTTGIGSWASTYAQSGTYHVRFGANDSELSTTEIVTITVNDIPLTITSYWNNVTGNNLSANIYTNDLILFGVTTNRSSNVTWYGQGYFAEINTNTTQGNYTTSWSDAGIYKINVSATDGMDTTFNTTFTVVVSATVSPPAPEAPSSSASGRITPPLPTPPQANATVVVDVPEPMYVINISGVWSLISEKPPIEKVITAEQKQFWILLLCLSIGIFISGIFDKTPKIKSHPAIALGLVGIIVSTFYLGFENILLNLEARNISTSSEMKPFWTVILIMFCALFVSGIFDKNPKVKPYPAIALGLVGILMCVFCMGWVEIVI